MTAIVLCVRSDEATFAADTLGTAEDATGVACSKVHAFPHHPAIAMGRGAGSMAFALSRALATGVFDCDREVRSLPDYLRLKWADHMSYSRIARRDPMESELYLATVIDREVVAWSFESPGFEMRQLRLPAIVASPSFTDWQDVCPRWSEPASFGRFIALQGQHCRGNIGEESTVVTLKNDGTIVMHPKMRAVAEPAQQVAA